MEIQIKQRDPVVNKSNVSQYASLLDADLPPIHPSCEASVVVPVYREFGGGEITRLLTDLETQTIGEKRFETILVVNNPPSSDLDSLPGLMDNLRLISYFKGQKEQGRFSNVHLIDCTRGELPRRHMGLARGLGQSLAESRLARTWRGDQGVIVQLDADTSVDPQFLDKLLDKYQNGFVKSSMIGRIPLPIDFKSDDFYLSFASSFAQTVDRMVSGKGGFFGDGPTLAFRAAVHKWTKGYMRVGMNEDFLLGEELESVGGMYLLTEPRIYKGDRIRPDGFDSRMRSVSVGFNAESQTVEGLLRQAFPGNSAVLYHTGESEAMYWTSLHAVLSETFPKQSQQLDDAIMRERVLAGRTLDFAKLNPNLLMRGLYLYALSRMVIGDQQMLRLTRRQQPFPYSSIITKQTTLEKFDNYIIKENFKDKSKDYNFLNKYDLPVVY